MPWGGCIQKSELVKWTSSQPELQNTYAYGAPVLNEFEAATKSEKRRVYPPGHTLSPTEADSTMSLTTESELCTPACTYSLGCSPVDQAIHQCCVECYST